MWKVKLIQPERYAGIYVIRARHSQAKKTIERSTGTRVRREAERQLAEFSQQLKAAPKASDVFYWDAFLDRFRREHLQQLSAKGRSSYETAIRHFESIAKPRTLLDCTAERLSDFRAKLLGQLKGASVATYVRHVQSALSWAKSMGWIAAVPELPRLKATTANEMRGFPLSLQHVRQMIRAVPIVRGKTNDAAAWQRLIRLMWLGGFRLTEAATLRWNDGRNFVDLNARPYPLIVIRDQKSGKATRDPMPPDLARWLAKTPANERTGLVAPVKVREKISETISAIGIASGIVVDGRTPTAHDIRRGFGTKWAARVMPLTLQKMMRHASFATTAKFYARLQARDMGRDLWKKRTPT
jgi:integrase